MAIFLFVPGAWHSSWCFERVGKNLREEGHQVIALDLPGIHGDVTELAKITLESWGRFVADTALAQPAPVVLCGHSRGGSVISTAAEMEPTAACALVYIAAFMLPNGDSPAAFKARQPTANPFARSISVIGENAATRIDPDKASEFLYNMATLSDRRRALQRLVPDPYLPSRTSLRLSKQRFGSVLRYYVECTEDRIIPISEQRSMQQKMPVEAVETLTCDHSPFLSDARALAKALARISVRLDRRYAK